MHPERTQDEATALCEQLAELPQVTGAYVAGTDGFLLDAIAGHGGAAEQLAALSAILHGATARSGVDLGLGPLRWIALEMERGNVVMIAATEQVLLTVTTEKKAALGGILHAAAQALAPVPPEELAGS